jgi:hypothetical protein
MYHFVYNSYEEWGRNYIGVHSTENLYDGYLGSYSDPTFTPVGKDILEFYETRGEACEAEIRLHQFFDVANNPSFANQANAHNTGIWPYHLNTEARSRAGKRGGKVKSERKLASCRENGRKGAPKISHRVQVTNTLTEETFECYSIREAARQTGLHYPWAYELVKGKREEVNGWKITYANN